MILPLTSTFVMFSVPAWVPGNMTGVGVKKLAVCAVALLAAASQTVAAQTSPLAPRKIPAADFAKERLLSGPMLSPDGKRLIAQSQRNGKQLLLIHSFDGTPSKILAVEERQDIGWYRWAGNGRILVSVAQTIPWLDDEARVTRLMRYDLATGTIVSLGNKRFGLEGDDLLYTDPSGDWILLSAQKTIYDYPSVFKIDLATNKLQEVVKQRPDVWEWFADNDGVVRAGIGFDTAKWSMVYRKTEAEKFRKLGKARYDDEDAAMDILRFARDSDDGYVLRNHETGRFALYKFNFATKQVGEKIFESPTNDVTDFDMSLDGKSIESVSYTDDRDRIVWFDAKLKETQAAIDAAVKSNEAWIVSRSRNGDAMLVWVGASNNPGSHYLYRPSVGLMQRIATANSALKPSELAPSKYYKYKARDGLEIPGYLTLPKGRDPKGLPLIILPHGGPYGVRDRGDYDPEVQFLANRGYAVLQPNYRGSEGYGKAFYEKGEAQWGRQMQDDLDDGMDALAKEGTIDPKRVCIVGSSYGGYAAMWGVTRNPERYRCGASFAGVMDLNRQLKYQLDFGINRRYRKNWRQTVQGTEDVDLKSLSPQYTAAKLTRPVLLTHGDADQTVPYKQSKNYVDALKKEGKAFEFQTYVKEGHGFSNNAHLKDWLERLDAFLTKHNPAN